MSSVFDQTLTGFRYANTHFGDTLQVIAYREMGDAAYWPQIAWMNGLVYPFITDDPLLASDTVLLSGSPILIPAARQSVTAETPPSQVYGRDCSLAQGILQDDGNGDLLVASGIENFKQQITNRTNTPKGDLIFHPNYGCRVSELKGQENMPTYGRLAAEYVKVSLLEDYRVASVISATSVMSGDTNNVISTVQPITGNPIDIVTRA